MSQMMQDDVFEEMVAVMRELYRQAAIERPTDRTVRAAGRILKRIPADFVEGKAAAPAKRPPPHPTQQEASKRLHDRRYRHDNRRGDDLQ